MVLLNIKGTHYAHIAKEFVHKQEPAVPVPAWKIAYLKSKIPKQKNLEPAEVELSIKANYTRYCGDLFYD
jgi:hypothetical protein